jgi:hypothetical protein
MKEDVPKDDEVEDPLEAANFGADLALVLSVALTIVVYELPFAHTIAWPLVLLSTFAHELGHGLTALVLGGKFDKLLISPDASGLAYCRVQGSVSNALVSAGGLVGPACAAAFLFVLARFGRLARASLLVMALAMFALIPTLLDGTYGKVFVGAVALLFLAVGAKAPPWLAKYTCAFVAVQLALSVYSRGDYLFTDTAHMATGDMPSDVANMAKNLFLPYWFWGGVCAIFSVLVLLVGARLFLRGLPGRSRAPQVKKPEGQKAPSPSEEVAKLIDGLKNPTRDRA